MHPDEYSGGQELPLLRSALPWALCLVLSGCTLSLRPKSMARPQDCEFVPEPPDTWVADGKCRRQLLGWTACEPIDLGPCSSGGPTRTPAVRSALVEIRGEPSSRSTRQIRHDQERPRRMTHALTRTSRIPGAERRWAQ